MREDIKHSVLGSEYSVVLGKREEIGLSEDNMGECRIYGKEILVSTDSGDCSCTELEKRVQEVVAHEMLHAYLNEAGIGLDDDVEEMLCCFYMKNWRKLNNSILEVLEESGFLDS